MGDPRQVGPYEIILPIAKGGMATVFLARSEGLGGFDRYVALKLTAPSLRHDPEFAAHLVDEGKLVAHLRHTNIVPVLDVGDCELGIYLVMEYVPGDSLSGLVRAGKATDTPLPTRVGLRILHDALVGLHAAHEHADEEGHPLHIVHRDFSPQNILVGTDGVARLTDFGIAKAVSRASSTVSGLIKGKISYCSPEQAHAAPVDRRSDLWSAGIVAWELVAGRKLYGTNDKALLEIVKADPPRVKTVAPDVPEALDDAIERVLKLDPDRRTPTAAALARDLAEAARPAGLLADREEVAEQVARLAGPTLAERKAQIAEARRARRPGSAPDLATLQGVPSLDVRPRRPLPSLPDVPVTIDAGAVSAGEEGDDVPIAVESELPRDWMRWVVEHRSTLLAGGAGLAGFLVLAVIVALVASGGGASHAAAAASASASAVKGATSTGSPATLTVPASAAPARDDAVWPVVVEVVADEPIAQVRIAGRVTDISSPTLRVNVELEAGEDPDAMQVAARTADGKTASGAARAGVVNLSFANAPLPQRPRRR
jgi:serine/threonine-protein kinase